MEELQKSSTLSPLTPHWADQTAVRVVAQKGDKNSYTVASGITPSGVVHFGNFREVITVDFVARALRDRGKDVRFIYSWDNFDTFRKVPKNVPNPEAFMPYLRRPIARIPDPWGQEKSYASSRIKLFENELKRVGIAPIYFYQEQKYAAGEYAENIRKALESKDKIAEILNRFRKEPLAAEWLPTSIYCSKCQSDNTSEEKYLGAWDYSYKCADCGNSETVDIRKSSNIKLAWRCDWPMRWSYEKVDFEPGGKDHSSEGGSYDTAKDIVKVVWQQDPPVYLQYDFVSIKGGAGKMSSSSGELVTLSEVLEIYTPQMVRWIFAGQKPNRDFSIAFDEDVIKTYEEFDKCEKMALSAPPEKLGSWPVVRRAYELSNIEADLPKTAPFRPAFRDLCSRLQITGEDINRVYERFYSHLGLSEQEKKLFDDRAVCALNWLKNHAPEQFRYSLRRERKICAENELQVSALKLLKSIISEPRFAKMEAEQLNQELYDRIIKGIPIDAKDFFKSVYQTLVARDQGPRLPSFLKEIGQDKLMELL